MNARQHQIWKEKVRALRSAPAFDYTAATKLVIEIASEASDAGLLERAKQALPSLRLAVSGKDKAAMALAQRRFGIVHDALHSLTLPQFGRRRRSSEQPPAGEPAPSAAESGQRLLLGLPTHGTLHESEIQEAYRRKAKKAHPDGGGSRKAFLELVKARDALLTDRQKPVA